MAKRKFKGIWIPAALWLCRELNATEKAMVAEVDSLDADGDGCRAKNAYLADFFGLSVSRTAHLIAELSKRGWLRVELNDAKNDRRLFTGIRYAEVCAAEVIELAEGGIAENSMPPLARNSNPPIAENSKGGLLDLACPNIDNKRDNGNAGIVSDSPQKKGAQKRMENLAQAEIILLDYPKKRGANATRDANACIRALKFVPFETLRQVVRDYARAMIAQQTEERFVMSAANFFDRERYLEDWATVARQGGNFPATGTLPAAKPAAPKFMSAEERRKAL